MNIKQTLAALACTTVLVGVSACGAEESSSGSQASSDESSETTSESPSPSEDMSEDAMGGLVGPGCADYAKAVPSGAGSVDGMAQDKVATAASNNPLLKTLTAAVSGKLNKKVNLVDALNGGEFTVFAPVDDAFAKLPKKTVKALSQPKNAKMLSSILTYHVVEGQLAPDAVAGQQATLQGGKVKVAGSGDNLTVNNAKVICGGVKTANATVYLIDTVMSPKM